MDKNHEDILKALKSHLTKNKDFIDRLKKLKPQNKPTSPQSDQTKIVDVYSRIQEIKETLKTVEHNIEDVIENLSPNESTVSEKGEEKSSVTHFQVYERDMHTEDFVIALQKVKKGLLKGCIPGVIQKVSDIDINKPLIILCQSGSRLVPDINYSLEHFEDLNSVTRLAIVVIHNKERHALPTTSSQSILSGDVKFKNMWIIDAAFTNALKFYDCKMNNEAMATIVKFLKSD